MRDHAKPAQNRPRGGDYLSFRGYRYADNAPQRRLRGASPCTRRVTYSRSVVPRSKHGAVRRHAEDLLVDHQTTEGVLPAKLAANHVDGRALEGDRRDRRPLDELDRLGIVGVVLDEGLYLADGAKCLFFATEGYLSNGTDCP